MNNSSTVPAVILAEGREKALNRKHPWIFSNAIAKVHNTPNRGDTVAVLSSKGEWLAWAAYSPASQIRARIWSFEQDQQIDQAFFKQRLRRAWQLRQSDGQLRGPQGPPNLSPDGV